MALDPNKKFLYFNKDETSTEMDLALCFPVSSFIGIETQTSSRMDFFFEGAKGSESLLLLEYMITQKGLRILQT